MELPPFVTRELVAERLPLIFPEGIPNRNYCVRELAASTVFTALYIGAVEGTGRFLGPVHVYRMTAEQAAKADTEDRLAYDAAILAKSTVPGSRWYADNTREPIRDETLRDGLVSTGAVMRREDLPTTSGLPRYSLKIDFASLFDPILTGTKLENAIAAFQARNLSKGALARVAIIRAGALGSSAGVLVTFPSSNETRQLAPGPSSIIAKAVVEVFAAQFLEQPAVLWLSESGNKVVVRDDQIASSIGLKIEPDQNLPDLILADLGPAEPLLIFVEVVATDGAITQRRRAAIFEITDSAGFDRDQVKFVTAYLDRESAGFRKTASQLAWGTFAWFVSEPENILIMRIGGDPVSLFSLDT